MADARGVAAVLCAVGGIDLVVNIGGGLLHESDGFVDPTSPDVTFVAHLNAAEPGAAAPIYRPDVEGVIDA